MNRSYAVLLSPVVLAFCSLFVVPPVFAAGTGTCTDPTSNSVNICMPDNNFTIDGPVELSAAANVNGLTLMRVYDNSNPVYETTMSSFDTFLYLGSGLHQITVIAYDNGGNAFQKDTNISVTDGSAAQPCGIPQTDATINICYPTSGKTVGSPVTISAKARWDCCAISHIRLYRDNQDVWDADYPTFVFAQLPMSPGSHDLVAIAWDNAGNYIQNSATFTVTSTSCTPTSQVSFCFPANNDTVPTPVQVTAASSTPNLTLLRLYDNNQNVYETPHSSFSTNLNIGQGLHHLVVVAYDSLGNAYTDQRYIRVTGTGTQFPCGIPEYPTDINICATAEFSTVNSPVTVSAWPNWDGQVISHLRIYMDNQDVYDANYGQIVNHQFPLASGGHYMVIIAWDNAGNYIDVARTFFVP
jgi:hypothetical protein